MSLLSERILEISLQIGELANRLANLAAQIDAGEEDALHSQFNLKAFERVISSLLSDDDDEAEPGGFQPVADETGGAYIANFFQANPGPEPVFFSDVVAYNELEPDTRSIEILKLPKVVYQCLWQAGVRTVDAVIRQVNAMKLHLLPNSGPVALHEVLHSLEEIGYNVNRNNYQY